MNNRKSSADDEMIAPASTNTPVWKRRTPEEWRQRILEHLEQLPHPELLRVDQFVRAVLRNDPVLMSIATAPEDTNRSARRIKPRSMRHTKTSASGGSFPTSRS